MNFRECSKQSLHVIFCWLFAGLPAIAQQRVEQTSFPKGEVVKQAAFSYIIVPAPNNTFGYELFRDDKLFIRQMNIPGMLGMDGFKGKTAAERVAALVIQKLRAGEMPPTVTKAEMEALNAL